MGDPVTGETPQIEAVTDDGWRAVSASRSMQDTTPESLKDAAKGLSVEKTEAPAEQDQAEYAQARDASADGADNDAEAKADAGKPSDEAKNGPGQGKKNRALERQAQIQARINALKREEHEIERRLAQRKAALSGDPQAMADQTAENIKAVPVKKAEAGTMPVWEEYEKAGKEFAEFQSDWASWDANRLAARDDKIKADLKRELEQEQRARAEKERAEAEEKSYFARIDKAREQYEDFDEAVEALGDLRYDDSGMWADVVQQHPQGADILYYLAKHPDHAKALMGHTWTTGVALGLGEAENPVALTAYLAEHPEETERILEMPRPRAIRALTLLDSKLGSTAAEGANTASASPSTAPVTRAKAPIRAVGGTRTSGDSRDPIDLPFGPEYVRRMNERDRQSRRA